ncbi:MAG: sensor histidine kinase, partial [Bacteroidota bacterium]
RQAFSYAPQALRSALSVARQYQEVDHEKYLLEALVAVAEQQQNYHEALEYLRTLNHIEDSIFTAEQYQVVADLKEKYEVVDKEKLILSQALDLAERDKVNFRLYALLVFLGVCLAALLVLFRQRQLLEKQRLLAATERERSVRLEAMDTGQEAERRRIARDLHDGLGGLLSTIRLQLSAINTPSGGTALKQPVTRASELVETACNEVRRIAHDLLPDALLQLGFVAAAHDLITKHNQALLPVFSCEVLGQPVSFSDEQKLLLYRSLQELLQNVVKHADASAVWVRIAFTSSRFSLSVEDDGVGFDTSIITAGIGLANLQTRAERLGAELTVESSPGNGSFFELTFPFEG